MASKIKKKEWIMLYVAAGMIDVIQFLADLLLTEAFAAPEIVSEVADPFIGLAIGGYFQFRGVDMIHQPKRILSLVGITGLEEFTGGMAPAWIMDIWYIHRSVRMEEAELQAQRQQEMLEMQIAYQNRPLYQDGMRVPQNEQGANGQSKLPRSTITPLNSGGTRNPTKTALPGSSPRKIRV